MVDFRYHLVLFVLVFMAFAIGVVLGTSPFQNSIGTMLLSWVEPLRKSRDEARTEADTANNALFENEKRPDSAGAQLVGGTLRDRRVVIIVLPGVEDSDLKAAEDEVSKADATVAGTVTLVDPYAAAPVNPYRNTSTRSLAQHVGGKSDADPHVVVASGASRSLPMGSPDPSMTMIRDTLTAEDNQMIQIQRDVEGGVQAVVMVTPKKMEIDRSVATPAVEAESASNGYVKMVRTLSSEGSTTTVGEGIPSTGLLAKMREVKGAGSAVDSLDAMVGRTNVAIAVTSEIKGSHVHLGQGDDARAIIGTYVGALMMSTRAPEPAPGPTSEEG